MTDWRLSLISFALVGGASFSEAFVPTTSQRYNVGSIGMASSATTEEDTKPVARRSGPDMSVAIPFLARPPILDGELAGDVGFDPLGFAKNRESLWELREAEVKHARLAMLVSVITRSLQFHFKSSDFMRSLLCLLHRSVFFIGCSWMARVGTVGQRYCELLRCCIHP